MKKDEIIYFIIHEIEDIRSYPGTNAIIISNHRFQDDFLNPDILLYVFTDVRKKRELFSKISPYTKIWIELIDENFVYKLYDRIESEYSLNKVAMLNDIKTAHIFYEKNKYLTNLRANLTKRFTLKDEFIKKSLSRIFLYSSDAASKIIENDIFSASLLVKDSMDHILILYFTLDNINIFQQGIRPRNNWLKIYLEKYFPEAMPIYSRLDNTLDDFSENNFEHDFVEVTNIIEDIASKIGFNTKSSYSSNLDFEFEE